MTTIRRVRSIKRKKQSEQDDYFADSNTVGLDPFAPGTKVWIQSEDTYKKAVIKDKKGDSALHVEIDGDIVDIDISAVKPTNPDHLDKVADMARLTYLNEPSVYYNLDCRYREDLIYTYSGLFLVVVNPYKKIPNLYTQQTIDAYKGKVRDDMPPHVYCVADSAYRNMINDKQNQSMLVTGESGAGKTENTKKIIQYLTSIAGHSTNGELEQQILRTNPLLEAFGNACTIKNNNSSRFGKFIEIGFNSQGYIVGTKIINYLLETPRVTYQAPSERTFHIFYQMYTDNEFIDKYKLPRNIQDCAYVNPQKITADDIDDRADWAETKKCMSVIGIKGSEQEKVFDVLASILHLGQVKFTPDNKGNAELVNKEPLKIAAKLLGVSGEELEKSFSQPKIEVRNEVIETQENPERAEFNKSALVKSIYRRLFNWLVSRINESLVSKEKVQNSIGLLDIAGFEIFDLNSFEQLCINFTNEKLQQFFNNHMFKKEQEEYLREKIEWKFIDFGLDLQPTIDLLERQGGVLPILDQQTTLGQNDDKLWADTLKKSLQQFQDAKWSPDKFDQLKLNIVHYAGEVPYDLASWVQKNTDPLTQDTEKCMANSKNKFISTLLFSESGTKKKGKAVLSIAREYKDQLENLMSVLRATDPHFIRCIIPNHKKMPGWLDSKIVLGQLRCNGVLEGIRISRKGYPGRILFAEFIQRYKCIANQEKLDKEYTMSGKAKQILEASGLLVEKHYMIGQTKVFFKAGAEGLIDKVRDRRISEMILFTQAAMRGYLARKQYALLLSQIDACRLIQMNWRSFMTLRSWSWWNIFSRARALVDPDASNKEDEEFKKQLEDLKAQLEEEIRLKRRTQNEKGDVLVEIEKLKGDIMSGQSKNEELKSSITRLEEREKDLQAQIDAMNRENKQAEDEARRLNLQATDFDNQLGDKNKNIEDMNSSLGMGSGVDQKLKQQLDDLKKEKVKLESQVKQYDDDIKELKTKMENEMARATEFDKQKTQLDEKLKEITYRLQNAARDKQLLEEKQDDALKSVKDTDSILKALLNDIQNLMNDDGLKTGQLSVVQAELEDVRRRVDNAERDRKISDAAQRDLQEKQSDNDTKRVTFEKSLKNAREETENLQREYNKLLDEHRALEESGNNNKDDIGTLRIKVQQLEDENVNLTRRKGDAERDLSTVKFDLDEQRAKYDRMMETLNKKLSETEKTLKATLEQETQNKQGLEQKTKSAETQARDLKRQQDMLQQEKDQLDAKFKRLEQSMSTEQQDTFTLRKQTGDLETATRIQQNKVKELEMRLQAESDDSQRAEQKRVQLQASVNEQRDTLDQLEKEMEELEKQRGALKQTISQLRQEVDTKKDLINQTRSKQAILEGELKSYKDRCEDVNKNISQMKPKNKDTESKVNSKNMEVEQEKSDIKSLEQKIARAEQSLANLKKKLEEEQEKTRVEKDTKNSLEGELREKRAALEAEQRKISELNIKLKSAQAKLEDFDNGVGDDQSKGSKLKTSIYSLNAKKTSLMDQRDDLHKKVEDAEYAKKAMKDKIDSSDKQRNIEQQAFQRLAIENQKLKTELEKTRVNSDEVERKNTMTLEQLKNKLEQLEHDHEFTLRKLNDEKAELKKQQKNATRAGKTASSVEDLDSAVSISPEGRVSQEAVDKAQKEYEAEQEKLRTDLETQKKERISVDASKRTLDLQLSTLRDQVEQEERARKKIEVAKKSLQLELDDIRLLADEADETREEIERVRKEHDEYKKELQADREREKVSRAQAEEQIEKCKNEVDEIKKQLMETKNTNANNLKTLRSKYERQIADIEEVIDKAKKDKTGNHRDAKKVDRSLREITRRLENAELDLQNAEEKTTAQNKELKKYQDEYQVETRKLNAFESQNALLQKDIEAIKERIAAEEEEARKLKNDVGSSSGSGGKTSGKTAVTGRLGRTGRVATSVEDGDDEEEQ